MIEQMIHGINNALGIYAEHLTLPHMALRAICIYVAAITLIRVGKKRFLAKPSSFDLVLILILGSVISRAINTPVPFYPTIGACIVLVLMHTFFGYITYHSTLIGRLIKGRPLVLIKEGKIQWKNMESSHITERDLMSAIRRNAQILDPEEVMLALLERNGEISVIRKPQKPVIIATDVKDGVQHIKIELRG